MLLLLLLPPLAPELALLLLLLPHDHLELLEALTLQLLPLCSCGCRCWCCGTLVCAGAACSSGLAQGGLLPWRLAGAHAPVAALWG